MKVYLLITDGDSIQVTAYVLVSGSLYIRVDEVEVQGA